MVRHLNLLPPERRARLRRGAFVLFGVRIVRLLIVGLGVVSVGGGLLIVGMWLLTITFSGAEDAELQNKVKEYLQLRAEISEKNQLLRLVNELGRDRIIWSDQLAEFLEAIPPGTIINSLTGDSRVGIFEFSGTALTRGALVVFEERLGQLSWAKSIAAPRQNFLKKNNPDYTFEIRLRGFGVTGTEEND